VFVVHVESLRATSLIHSGKFSKHLNTTTSTSTTTEETPSEKPKNVVQEEVADEEVSPMHREKVNRSIVKCVLNTH
jgi:hypothetical protein